MQAVIENVDCSRYSSDRGSPVCEERGEAALGALAIIVVLVLIAGYVFWRRVTRRYGSTSADTEPRTDAEREAVRRRLEEEYEANVLIRDADTLEASRDWHDNLASPWRVQAGAALAFVVLFGSLLVLIPLFLLFKSLAQ